MKQARQLAVIKHQKLKIKKHEKVLELLEKYKEHNSSITPKTIDILDSLNEKQLINEISYLRLTILPKIKQRRRVKLDSGKFKIVNFTMDELLCSIHNAIKPDNLYTTQFRYVMSNEMFVHVNDGNGN